MTRDFAGLSFNPVGPIQPEEDQQGQVAEVTFPLSNDKPLHRYGQGPFCRFQIAHEDQWRRAGVYVIACDDNPRYVGECKDLSAIWKQIGRLRPSAVRIGGQQTFCRVNTAILNDVNQGQDVSLWFRPVDDSSKRRADKANLIKVLNPAWNRQSTSHFNSTSKRVSPSSPSRTRSYPATITQPSPVRNQDGDIAITRTIEGRSFSYVGPIRVERCGQGDVVEYLPQSRYLNRENLPFHPYGHGPFCRLHVASGWKWSGVYVLTRNNEALYVGECETLERRWGPMGYGHISPRACFKGGQDTNCRINNLILQGVKNAQDFDLWFHPVNGDKQDRLDVERTLVSRLTPPWNR